METVPKLGYDDRAEYNLSLELDISNTNEAFGLN
jgi:hypothetical protein